MKEKNVLLLSVALLLSTSKPLKSNPNEQIFSAKIV